MNSHETGKRWAGMLAWAIGLVALVSVALASPATPSSIVLVTLSSTLMLLFLLRWRMAERRFGAEREQTMALLRQTLESTADGFLLLDLHGRVVSFNRKLAEMSGLSAESLQGGEIGGLTGWMMERVIEPEAFLARMEELAADPLSEALDQLRLRDGRIFERYTRPHRIGERIAGRVWSFRDVTAERTALAELHRREEQLAEAQRIARLGSFEWDLQRDEVHASAELWRIVGQEPPPVPWTMERHLSAVHPADRARARERVRACAAEGEPLNFDLRVIRSDGERRYVAAAGRLVRDGDGAPRRLIGTLQDVTDRVRGAAALRRSVRVEQTLTRVSQLLTDADAMDATAVLRALGDGLGGDRAFLIQATREEPGLRVVRSDEWCAHGIEPMVASDPAGAVPPNGCWERALEGGEPLLLTAAGDRTGATASERAFLERTGIRSVAAVPLRIAENGATGLLGIHLGSRRGGASEEDLRALRRAAEMLSAHLDRAHADREIARRDAILEAMSFAAEGFLRSGDWQRDLDVALERIGRAAGASHVTLYDLIASPEGPPRAGRRAGWAAEDSEGPDEWYAEDRRVATLEPPRWAELLRRNQPVQEIVRDLPPEERGRVAADTAGTVLLIPIFVGDSWWGFLRFDDRLRDRVWSHAEREVLMAAGRMIGAGIQRRQAEQALRESELRFKQLSENIPEVFFMATADFSQLLYLSPAFETVWGRSLLEAHANPKALAHAVLAEDLPILTAHLGSERGPGGDASRQVDFRIARPDGSIRWIRSRIIPIADADGRPYRIAGISADVTELRQFEEEARRASRIEAIGHLAAGIAHEINTPIQYVGDNLRFLADSYENLRAAMEAQRTLLEEARRGAISPERAAAVARVLEAAEVDYLLAEAPRASEQALDGVRRVAEIVRAMKEFSHPGTGTKVPTDLNQAVRNTTTVARNEWKYVADLVTELDPTLPNVYCLPGELNQALLNLVVNAAHAITDRQTMEGHAERGTISIRTALAGDTVEIRIRDTGTGIPEAIRPRIFDPFFTTKDVGRGTGQGLTFVHSIVVEKHGGSITFETTPGAGTTFIVHLPIAEPSTSLGVAA